MAVVSPAPPQAPNVDSEALALERARLVCRMCRTRLAVLQQKHPGLDEYVIELPAYASEGSFELKLIIERIPRELRTRWRSIQARAGWGGILSLVFMP